MKTLFLSLMALMPFILFAQSGEKNFIDFNYIEVTGKAEMEVTPNEIYLNIRIDEKDSKGKENLEELEKKMVAVLEEIGVDTKKDLSIQDFSSNFKFYFLRGDKIFTSKEYQLITHEGRTTGLVYQELERIGISNITIEKVDHSEIEKYRREVKIKAVKAAKEKATEMAEAIGQSAGKAIYIQEYNNNIYPLRMDRASNTKIMVRGASSMADQSLPEIEFQKIDLEYSVLVRFELK